MLGKKFRPWGQLHWVLSKLPTLRWSILGCLGTEERSIALWEYFNRRSSVGKSTLVRVQDLPSRFSNLSRQLLEARLSDLARSAQPSEGIQVMPLFSSEDQIVRIIDHFVGVSEENVILDITSLPKRFFFPFVHRLLSSSRIKNLVVTYTSPERYHDGPLAEDHKSLEPLPLFRAQTVGANKVDLVIIGVGFMPLGLADFLEKYKYQQVVQIRTLLPFPPGPPGFQRNWRFINALRKDYAQAVKDPVRVEAHDTNDIFNHICSLTDGGRQTSEFGPFGPKPMSLAMCLFARLTKSVVRYTQPSIYHPEYTKGVRVVGGEPLIRAYCIRLGGTDLYEV